MRQVIEITRHNCPRDGDSITAEVTLDVGEGVTDDKTDDCASPTVTPVGTRVVRWTIASGGWQFGDGSGPGWEPASEDMLRILERDCDPVALAIEKLTLTQSRGETT